LAAGFIDLGLFVAKKRLIDHDFYRLGDGFPWIIPVGVMSLALLAGAPVALVARLRRRGVPLRIALALPSFVAFLDLCAKLPLAFWASLLLSGGLAVQFTRLVGQGRHAFFRVASVTAPLLAGAVLVLGLSTTGRRAWTEYREAAMLPPPPSGAPNVLLIVWDTVRAQNLSAYGYRRPTSPNLQRLAARGVRFGRAFATSPWTLPSHASLFTGRWPHELSAGWKTPLDDREPTLAGQFGSLGYDTAAFVANLDYCGRETGLGRGFVHYEDYPLELREVLTRYVGLGRRVDPFSLAMVAEALRPARPRAARPVLPLSKEHAKGADDVDREFLHWLDWQQPRHRPFFAFLNYNDAHTPYEVPDASAQGFGIRPTSWRDRLVLHQWNTLDKTKQPYRDVQMANDLYDDSIAYLDRRLGDLLGKLERRRVLDNAVVIVTSDHGEHLGDHLLFFHGCSLYRQLVDVPLVIVSPNRVPANKVVAEPVSLRDLGATILDLAGFGRRSTFPGRSLAGLWDQRPSGNSPPLEPLLMEAETPPILTNQGREPVAKGPMEALVAGGMHYIRTGDGREELYALELDPEETTNAAAYPDAQQALQGFRNALRTILRARPRRTARADSGVETE
jgi:arylsulfatase A-like enzyme